MRTRFQGGLLRVMAKHPNIVNSRDDIDPRCISAECCITNCKRFPSSAVKSVVNAPFFKPHAALHFTNHNLDVTHVLSPCSFPFCPILLLLPVAYNTQQFQEPRSASSWLAAATVTG